MSGIVSSYYESVQAPDNLANHMLVESYEAKGMDLASIVTKNVGYDIDFPDLIHRMKEMCPDFGEHQIDYHAPQQSLFMASKLIYDIGPSARKIKKGAVDQMWKFKFLDEPKVRKGVLYVSTFRQESNNYVPLDGKDKKYHANLSLTTRQASLLAVYKFNKMLDIIHTNSDKVFMTPLAGAIYSKDDLNSMAEELNIPKLDVVRIINSSCQSGGHFLEDSWGSAAVLAAFTATMNLKEESIKESIVRKVCRQYCNKGKIPEDRYVNIFFKYATGGVPDEFRYSNLMRTYQDDQREQITKRQMLRAQVTLPGFGNIPPVGNTTTGQGVNIPAGQERRPSAEQRFNAQIAPIGDIIVDGLEE